MSATPTPSPAPLDAHPKGNMRAYLLMTLSNTTFTIMQLCFKYLTRYVSPVLLVGVRGSLLFLMNVAIMGRAGLDSNIRDPFVFRMVVKRAVISCFTVALFLGSLQKLPIGIANALQNTSPIMAFFIDLFYYRRAKVYWANLIIILASFTGVLLIVQPEFLFSDRSTAQSIPGIYYAMVLLGAFFSALSLILLHDLRNSCHELVALQHSYFFQFLFNYLLYVTFFGNSVEHAEEIREIGIKEAGQILVLFVLLVGFAFSAQYLRVRSIYLCSPALVMPFNYVTVILGVAIDLVVFGSHYNGLIVLGMILASLGLFSKFVLLKIEDANKECKTQK